MRRKGLGFEPCTSMVVVAILAGGVDPRTAAAAEPVAQEAADERARRERANELMAQGEAHRAAGRHVEAAGAYAAAFDVLAERERPDADERLAVNLAVDELVLAQAAESESLTLVEEEAALLRRYEQRHGGLPPGLAQELARVTSRIEALRPKEPENATESVETTGPKEGAPDLDAGATPFLAPALPVDVEEPLALAPYPPAPPSGKHLFRAGIVVTASAVLLRGLSVINCAAQDVVVDCDIGLLYGVPFGGAGTLVGLGLLGGGAARKGKWLAHRDVLGGTTSTTSREQLGWGLFAFGVAWWAMSRGIAGAIVHSHDLRRAVGVEEVGWYTSVSAAAVGLALALHGRAHRRNRSRLEPRRRPRVAMLPALSPRSGGGSVVVSGRF